MNETYPFLAYLPPVAAPSSFYEWAVALVLGFVTLALLQRFVAVVCAVCVIILVLGMLSFCASIFMFVVAAVIVVVLIAMALDWCERKMK